ncbi:MAG TPA: DUF4397 domain-containing protein [Candidatus Baltobacteraceae bacterium]|nr:DUF4397 domain-containing protein [Candidatus Baltobacteraceae bacterium]
MKKFLSFALCAAALCACGKNATPSGSGAAAGTAYIRLVNGSADIETVNPQLPPTAPKCNFGSSAGGFGQLISAQVNGITAAASFPYEAVSSYVPVSQGTVNVSILYPGGTVTTGCPPLTFTTPALKAGSYTTVVVAGEYQSKTLQFVVFSDPDPASSPSAQISNASPQFGATQTGTFVPGTSAFQNTGNVAFGASASMPTASSAPGLAYFLGSASFPGAMLLPSQISSLDVNNVLPFGNFAHLSMYAIDPTPGGAAPNLIGALY